MRLVSTPDSIRNREVSALAIVETLAAMSVAAFLAFEFGTLKHIAVSACIAPFLLLQTERSKQIAISWCSQIIKEMPEHFSLVMDKFDGLWDKVEGKLKDTGTCWIIYVVLRRLCVILVTPTLLVIIGGFIFIVVRITAVFMSILHSPLDVILNIPKNWRLVTLCMDTAYPPEVVPGIELEEVPKELEHWRFGSTFRDLNSPGEFGTMGTLITRVFYFFPIFIFIYLPPMIYRWSLKSTALIWSPLLWVVNPATDDLVSRLHEICKVNVYRAMRYFSLVVALLFCAKLYILWSWHELMTAWSLWSEFAETWAKIPKSDILNAYIVPPKIPLWQLAAAVNAVLAWTAYFIADLLLVRHENHQSLPTHWLNNAFRWVAIIRNTLSLYVIACTLYITVELAFEGRWNLPPLGTKLFPWW